MGSASESMEIQEYLLGPDQQIVVTYEAETGEVYVGEKPVLTFDLKEFTGRLTVRRVVDDPTASNSGVEKELRSRDNNVVALDGLDDNIRDDDDAGNDAVNKPLRHTDTLYHSALSSAAGDFADVLGPVPGVNNDAERQAVGHRVGPRRTSSQSAQLGDSVKMTSVASGRLGESQSTAGQPPQAHHHPEDNSTIYSVSTIGESSSAPVGSGGSGGVAKFWSHVTNLAAFRRLRRENVPSAPRPATDIDPTVAITPTSRLHQLCSKRNVQLDELERALADHPAAAAIEDLDGRLPLHILGDNEALVGDASGRQVATAFAWTLMRRYPQGIVTTDARGQMPFVRMISDWVEWMYESNKKEEQPSSNKARNLFKGLAAHGGSPDAASGGAAAALPGSEKQDSILAQATQLFPTVLLWDEVDWCFGMLSLALDGLGGKLGGLHDIHRRNSTAADNRMRAQLATHLVTTIPALLKTIFLFEDDQDGTRKRLMRLSIFRRVLFCPEAVGSWLTVMLRRKGIQSERAIDILQAVSCTTVLDYVGGFRNVFASDVHKYEEDRMRVFEAVSSLKDVTVAILVLGNEEQERAASTAVVWFAMNETLKSSFVVSLVMIDFVLHVVLLLGFRQSVDVSGGTDGFLGSIPATIVVATCIHYFIRKGCEGVSIATVSRPVFVSYLLNLWTIFDVLTIILTFTAVTWNAANPKLYRPPFNTFVVALLWLKVLGFLKVVNKSMSTFILTLLQILRDLRFFVVVLIVVVVMFGDMFHVNLTNTDNGQFCGNNAGLLSDPAEDFCNPARGSSYLRVYALMLGDFELNDYRATPGMTNIFVFFTVIGTIGMLNLIIAVMSSSYEKAQVRSLYLFGRARVAFVAQTQALEIFLKPSKDLLRGLKITENPRNALVVGYRILRWLVLCTLIATAFYAEIFLVTRVIQGVQNSASSLTLALLFVLCFLLTLALFVIVYTAFNVWIRDCAPSPVQRALESMDGCSNFFTGFVATRVFGLNRTDVLDEIDDSAEAEVGGEEVWVRRAATMHSEFQKSLDAAKAELKQDIKNERVILEKSLSDQKEEEDDELQ